MTVFMLIIEALAACLFVLLPCVIGISNGAVNLICLYEKSTAACGRTWTDYGKEDQTQRYVVQYLAAVFHCICVNVGLRRKRRKGLLGRLLANSHYHNDRRAF